MTSVATADITQGIVAQYHFDEDANDSSGNGNDGVIYNANFVSGILGNGLQFTGNLNSYVEIPNDDSLNVSDAVTISLWVKKLDVSLVGYSALIYKAGENPTSDGFKDRVYSLWTMNNDGIHFTSTPEGSGSQIRCDSSGGLYELNKFVNIVGVVNATAHTMAIYVNGTKVQECSGYGDKIRGGNYPLRIGAPFMTSGDQSGFNGTIDQVSIYNRVLTDEEIMQLASTPIQISNNCGIVADYDSNTYDTLVEGNLCWLAKNLKSTHDASGNAITRYCFNGDSANCDLRGGLYDWDTVMNGGEQCDGTSIDNPICTKPAQGICPINWHVPSSYEYQNLGSVIGPSQEAFTGSTWSNGVPGWHDAGGYHGWDIYADYWSSTNIAGNPSRFAYGGSEYHNTDSNYPGANGFSTRCVKNIAPTPTPIPTSTPTNQPPDQPELLIQYKSDESELDTGSLINQRTVSFIVAANDPDNDQVKLQIELRRIDEYGGSFDENQPGLKESVFVLSGIGSIFIVNDLADGDYHWRARAIDINGNKGPWEEFGNNPTSAADFMVYPEFKFAQITDPHLGYYFEPIWDFGLSSGMENSVTSFTDKLQDIKGQNVEQIVVTGDLVEQNKPEFFTAFKNLVRGFNVSTTPGNHDRRTLFWGNDLANYQNIINPKLDWNFSYNGINIIGLNSGADYSVAPIPKCDFLSYNCISNIFELKKKSTPESDGLNDSQWNKLNHGEFSPAGQRQIITMHSLVISANNDTYDEDQIGPVPPDGGPGGNNEAIAHHRNDTIQYAINNRVDLVLGGHTHQGGIYNAAGNRVENTSANRPLFIQTRNDGYRIIEVKDGKANPFETKTPAGSNRKSSSIWFSSYSTFPRTKYGLHAYDSQNRHTGIKGCSGEFELGIPNSYYTGNLLETSSVPEVIVGYSDDIEMDKHGVTEYRIFSWCISGTGLGAGVSSAQSVENVVFNQSITNQNNGTTTETVFYNVTLESNSSASVNVSGEVNYIMEVDLTSDGIVDQVVIPDSVSTANNEPQNNISIVPYNGIGTINISADIGNVTSAGNMNISMFPEKQFYEFAFGMIAASISDLANGSKVNITIELPGNIQTDSQFWEYGKTADNNVSRWYRIPLRSNDGDNVIILQLQDGGVGDDDGIENGIIVTTGASGITSMPGINGTVINSATKTGIAGATVLTNTGNSTTTDATGFYSFSVSEGEYNLTAKLDPTYYMNNTIQVSTIGKAVAAQDIELLKKPAGSITGNVRN